MMARKLIQDDRELLQVSQMELKKLQRQYRVMEGDKNCYAGEIKCYLGKQRKIMETLVKEEKNLLTRMSFARPMSVPEMTHKWEKAYMDLLKTYERYLFLMKNKKDIIKKLEKKIQTYENERKVVLYFEDSKLTQTKEKAEKTDKQVQLLQNKLHQETVKYDKALSENSGIRREVDSLLKDRAKFNDNYKKLVMKLNADKKGLLTLIERATVACEQRDEADERLKQSLSKEYQETIAQKHKMRELLRQLDHLKELKEFISVKGQKRILIDLEKKQMEKKRESIANVETFIKKHDHILTQIKEFCEEQSTDRLPALFSKQEEENFTFFNYVNEINNEVEILQDEVQLLIKLREEQKLSTILSEQERIESYDWLRKEMDEKKLLREEEERKMSSMNSVLDEIFVEMKNVFSLFKESSSTVVTLLDELILN